MYHSARAINKQQIFLQKVNKTENSDSDISVAMATGGLGPGPGPGSQEAWSDIIDKESAATEGNNDGRSTIGDAGNKDGRGKPKGSWAQVLSSSLPLSWDKNVLEVVLEKDVRGPFNVSDLDCARVMRKLGLDSRPGVHVESLQICPTGRGVILITLKKDVVAQRFCRYDVLEVTESGIRAVNVKPAGKRELVITMRGIHPNTRDDGVLDYLSKYGRIVTDKVVYGVFTEGPLKGFRNSDRAYKIELKPGVNIGTYHAIDGVKVTARYQGQQQTCARCFATPQSCPGRGIARNCDAAGGPKVEFSDYIKNLWNTIGYSPENVELSDKLVDDCEEAGEVKEQEGGHFTPNKQPSTATATESFAGVKIKTFPREADHGAIVELLVSAGLPESEKDNIAIKPNGSVTISNLENKVARSLISNLHNKKVMGRRIFCNGIVPLTPQKDASQHPIAAQDDSGVVDGLNGVAENKQSNTLVNDQALSSSVLDIGSSADIQQFVADHQEHLATAENLVRRSPTPGSLTAGRLGSPSYPACGTLAKTKSLLSLSHMSEKLSDFGSCRSSSSSESESETDGFKSMNDKKRGWKKKRKLSLTPSKEELLKKQN